MRSNVIVSCIFVFMSIGIMFSGAIGYLIIDSSELMSVHALELFACGFIGFLLSGLLLYYPSTKKEVEDVKE